ncbi:hypothetical protein ACOSQ4_004072 [Xanthoceras sorbifolium]
MAKRNIISDAYIVSVVIDLIVEENFREYLNSIPSFPTQESTRISWRSFFKPAMCIIHRGFFFQILKDILCNYSIDLFINTLK